MSIGYGVAASIVAAGLLIGIEQPLKRRIVVEAESPTGDWVGNGTSLSQANCHDAPDPFSDAYAANCALPSRTGQSILAVGDSQTGHLIPLLSKLHVRDGVGIRLLSGSGHSFPSVPESTSLGVSLDDWKSGEETMRRFFDENLARLHRADLVVLSSRYEVRWSPYPLNRSMRSGEPFRFYDAEDVRISKARAYDDWKERMASLADAAGERGVSVVVFAPIPVFVDELPPWRDGESAGAETDRLPELDRDFVVRHFASTNAALREVAERHPNLYVFDALETVCPAEERTCRPARDGARIYRDQWHLSNAGSNALYAPLVAFLGENHLLR